MNRRRAVKARGKSRSKNRWIGRSLLLITLISVIEIAYRSGVYEKIDLAQSLQKIWQILELNQTLPPTDEAKSDQAGQSQTTTIAKTALDPSTQETDKDDLGLTRVQESKALGFPQPIETDDSKLTFDNLPNSENTPDGFNPANTAVREAETSGARSQPILQKDAVSGLLSIGNFKTINASWPQHSCADFAGTMLKDVGASPHNLSVEMNNAQISIYKICATNGSIVITCRGGKIVVSPRQARPDDQCVRSK